MWHLRAYQPFLIAFFMTFMFGYVGINDDALKMNEKVHQSLDLIATRFNRIRFNRIFFCDQKT